MSEPIFPESLYRNVRLGSAASRMDSFAGSAIPNPGVLLSTFLRVLFTLNAEKQRRKIRERGLDGEKATCSLQALDSGIPLQTTLPIANLIGASQCLNSNGAKISKHEQGGSSKVSKYSTLSKSSRSSFNSGGERP